MFVHVAHEPNMIAKRADVFYDINGEDIPKHTYYKYGNKTVTVNINYTANQQVDYNMNRLKDNLSVPVVSGCDNVTVNGTTKYSKIVDFSYDVNGQNKDNRSVLVVPRRAYYDNRISLNRNPRSILVILTEVEDATVNDIVACQINGFYSQSVNLIQEDLSWIRIHRQGHTHCLVTVQCLGLPVEAIVQGSNTSIIYKKSEDSFHSRVQTEKPLLITMPSLKSGSVVVCCTLFGHPKRFDEWLMYQKTIGVDLVKLNVHSSFSQRATQIYPYLNEALRNGFVQMETWKDIIGNRFYYYSKIVKYQDCVYSFMNTFEYALFFDHDEFLNPLIPGATDVHYYLDRLFRKKWIGSVYLPWKQMQCAPEPEALSSLSDGNLTSILSGNASYWRTQRKCAHRLRAVDSVNIHNVRLLLPGYRINYLEKEEHIVYVAHNRKNAKPCN